MNKKKRHDLLIIIPAYNEEENIPKVLEQLEQPQIKEIADVLVMNDASSDGTNWIVKGRNHTLITNVFNMGYGSALQLGYKYAVRRHYKYVIQMDADGQHDICNIPALYQALQTPDENGNYPDIVLGARYMEGSSPFPVSAAKKFAYALFRKLIYWGTGKKFSDPTTGLQGLSWHAFLYYSKYNHFDDKYPDANMIMQMVLLGFEVKEIPATMHPRTSGKSMHSGIKPFFYMFRMLFSILGVLFRIKVFKTEKKVDRERNVMVEK